MIDFIREARNLFEYSREIRRDLHQHPELGFKEYRTAEIIAQQLANLGVEVTTGLAETGVMGILRGTQSGKTILLRFDMDALPISELNKVGYISQNPGVMHACGHDGHIAIGLSAAKILAAHQNEINGTIKFIFQPAEEGLDGAKRMISAGVLKNPKPDYCLALHLWNEKPVGWVSVLPGALMAGAELFQVIIQGRGGHGAMPQQTRDPVIAAAQIVNALQSIVARNVSPLQSAVISVTYFHAGDAYNVIPQTAEIRGTIRTFDTEVRDLVIQRFKDVVHNLSMAMECTEKIELWMLTPALVNHPEVTAIVGEIVRENGATIVDSTYQTMASEDMAEFLTEIPGCFLLVGSANEDKGLNFAHHHPRFDFDEEALVYGTGWICAAAIGLLEKQPSV